jgi:hypothetical protein
MNVLRNKVVIPFLYEDAYKEPHRLRQPPSACQEGRVVSYKKRKIWKSVFLVLKHRFLPLSKPLPLIRGEALKEDFNFSLLV